VLTDMSMGAHAADIVLVLDAMSDIPYPAIYFDNAPVYFSLIS